MWHISFPKAWEILYTNQPESLEVHCRKGISNVTQATGNHRLIRNKEKHKSHYYVNVEKASRDAKNEICTFSKRKKEKIKGVKICI